LKREFHDIALGQFPVAIGIDIAEMSEMVFAFIVGDKAMAFLIREPFANTSNSLRHLILEIPSVL